jgi:hypothetical protein
MVESIRIVRKIKCKEMMRDDDGVTSTVAAKGGEGCFFRGKSFI